MGMTYDIANSVVVGLMKNFALEKAKINLSVFVVNMPENDKERYSKSYSGKTIEILY